MKEKQEILCLCPACRQNFSDCGAYSIRRVSEWQETKDACTYCGTRLGYDYYVYPRRSIREALMARRRQNGKQTPIRRRQEAG